MRKFTIYYKDPIGISNKADSYGADEFEAESKFKVLYPDCVIQETIEN
jgi:hypothetical protein